MSALKQPLKMLMKEKPVKLCMFQIIITQVKPIIKCYVIIFQVLKMKPIKQQQMMENRLILQLSTSPLHPEFQDIYCEPQFQFPSGKGNFSQNLLDTSNEFSTEGDNLKIHSHVCEVTKFQSSIPIYSRAAQNKFGPFIGRQETQ